MLNNNDIKIKHAIDRETDFYFPCIDCDFIKFETINRKK